MHYRGTYDAKKRQNLLKRRQKGLTVWTYSTPYFQWNFNSMYRPRVHNAKNPLFPTSKGSYQFVLSLIQSSYQVINVKQKWKSHDIQKKPLQITKSVVGTSIRFLVHSLWRSSLASQRNDNRKHSDHHSIIQGVIIYFSSWEQNSRRQKFSWPLTVKI